MARKFYTILLSFLLCGILSAQTTYYVNNLTGSNANTGTSPSSPKQTIQAAIVVASSGDSISVAATGVTYNDAVQLSGKTIVLRSTGGIPELSQLTLDQPSLNYSIFVVGPLKIDSIIFRNGLIYTGSNNAITLPTGKQGFDRSGVTGTNISHIVGSVRRNVVGGVGAVGRNEFPVGTSTFYRPLAITVTSGLPLAGVNLTVGHVASSPTGINGLPITDGIRQGLDVARYPAFYWLVTPDAAVSPAVAYHMELTAAGFSDFDPTDANSVGIIRRGGGATDAGNVWLNQGGQADNITINNVLTARRLNAVGGLLSGGAIFTFGLKSKMAIANPISTLKYTCAPFTFRIVLSDPPVFVGNSGPLQYSAVVLDPGLVKAVIENNDTLVVTAKLSGSTFVRLRAIDIDGDIIFHVFEVSVLIGDYFGPRDPIIGFSSKSFSFGNVGVGIFKDSTLTINNIGDPTWSVLVSSIVSTDSSFTTDKISGIATYCQPFSTIIRFTPKRTGSILGSLIVKSNTFTTPDTVMISGNGIPVVRIDDEIRYPAEFRLHQNYPNPFNPETRLKFDLPSREFVRINIYDVLGNKIDALVDKELEPGMHQIIWNGTNHAAGVYFCQLQAGLFVETKKLVLLK